MLNIDEVAKKIAEMMTSEYIKNHLSDTNEKDIALNATSMYVNTYNTSMQKLRPNDRTPFGADNHEKLTPFENNYQNPKTR